MADKFIYFIDYLKHEQRNSFVLTFEEIEKIIGEPLCASAKKYSAYWNPSGNHTFPTLIAKAGFCVEPDLIKKSIRFFRVCYK